MSVRSDGYPVWYDPTEKHTLLKMLTLAVRERCQNTLYRSLYSHIATDWSERSFSRIRHPVMLQKLFRNCLRNIRGFKRFTWPPNSPDFNPIMHLRDGLDKLVPCRLHLANLQD